MSDEGRTATAEAPAPEETVPHAAGPAPAPDACPRCGAGLRPDQEWCLNCGAAARTRVAGPSGWRAPVAIVGAVLAVALAGLVVAFLAVSDDSDELTRIAQQTTAQATPAPAPATPPPAVTPAPTPPAATSPVPTVTPAPGEDGQDPNALPPASGTDEDPDATPGAGDPGGTGSVGSWPEGEDAFTVVLLSSPSRSTARKRAQELASGGTEVGLLDSDDYKSLRGGYWVVFSGQYDSRDAAESAAEGLESEAPGAYVRKVTPR